MTEQLIRHKILNKNNYLCQISLEKRIVIMLYEYLIHYYKEEEPIFFSDLRVSGITKSAINQQLRKLCSEGKLEKYENGVYYLPKKSRLRSPVGINADLVARYKYVTREGRTEGFYSGHTFANQIGLSVQVPDKVEIVSNNTAAKVREVPIGKRIFIVRKSVVHVNEENVYVLQLLDLLKHLDIYMDENYDRAREKVEQFIYIHNITKADVDCYIRKFPTAVFKYYYELRLEDVLTQRR